MYDQSFFPAMIHVKMSFDEKSQTRKGVKSVPQFVEFYAPWTGDLCEAYFSSFANALDRLILQCGISSEDAKERDTKKIIRKISNLMGGVRLDGVFYYSKAKRADKYSTKVNLSNVVDEKMTDYEVMMIDSASAQASVADYCAVISNRIANLFTKTKNYGINALFVERFIYGA